MKKLLIVEDEVLAITMLERILVNENYEILSATSGSEAIELLDGCQIDGILLDLGLPDMDGLDVLKHIRNEAKTTHIPVIVVSAKEDEIDVILALEMGADDYIKKPYKRRELTARIKAIFRRVHREGQVSGKVIEFGNIKIFEDRHQVSKNNEIIEFGVKEFKLLVTLTSNPNRIFTRDELLDLVWHEDVAIEERTVDVHIRRIRKKIETDDAKPIWIETVRGLGYRFSK